MKDATVEDFVGAVRSVARGSDVIPAVLTGTLLSHIARDAVVHQRPEAADAVRSEEHTSELQSRLHLVCRLLLEKKKRNSQTPPAAGTGRRSRTPWTTRV